MTELVVLAAGASTRMGHPKWRTDVGGETALARILRVAAMPAIVVEGAHAVEAPGAAIVRNPRPERGRTGSLQLGLRAARASEVVVWPVDHPLATRATLDALLASPGAWVVPTFAGRGGHPLVLRDVAISAVLSAPPQTPLREIPAMCGLEPTRVPVADEGILANLDTPEDAARWRGV